MAYNRLVQEFPGTRLLGPNCPGIISPGKCNIGITSGDIALAGGPVGIVSRSGTLTYQALHELSQQGIGQTTCVGIGGDPVPGTNFIDCLAAFEADPETKAVMMIGEIGGSEEERAADFIASSVTKPVAAYVAGVTAPPGRKMGHAGAIISGSQGTAQAKMDALRAAGVEVAQNPTECGEKMVGDRAGTGIVPARHGPAAPARTSGVWRLGRHQLRGGRRRCRGRCVRRRWAECAPPLLGGDHEPRGDEPDREAEGEREGRERAQASPRPPPQWNTSRASWAVRQDCDRAGSPIRSSR